MKAEKLFANLVDTKRRGDHGNCANVVERDTAIEAESDTVFLEDVLKRLNHAHFPESERSGLVDETGPG